MKEKVVSIVNTDDLMKKLTKDLVDFLKALLQAEKPQDLIPTFRAEATLGAVQDIVDQVRKEQEVGLRQRQIWVDERAKALETSLIRRKHWLEAVAENRQSEVGKAEKGKFVVAGRIVDEATGEGLPNVNVKAFDMDRKYDDLLGSIRTDEMGYYRIEYTKEDFKDLFDKKPETYIEVLDEEGDSLFTSAKSFVHKAGEVEVIDAEVDASKLPTSLVLSETINHAVSKRTEHYEGRRLVLMSRAAMKSAAMAMPTDAFPTEPDTVPSAAPVTNVNAATLEELTTLSSIGPALAKAIVESRPFGTVDDLVAISGISRRMLDQLRGRITV